VISRDPILKKTLEGDKRGAIKSIFQGVKRSCILSSDLSAATDKIPHDLVRAYVAGIEESGVLSSEECQVLLALTTKQVLIYGDESVES